MADTDRSMLEAALAAVTDGVAISDARGVLHYVNDAAVRLLGASRSGALSLPELMTEAVDEAGAPIDPAQLPASRVLDGEPHAEATIRLRGGTSGEERRVLVTASPVADRPLAVSTFRDVTELHEREREQEQLRQELVDLSGIIGHDLRSPLSAIVMATALLGKVPLDDRGARALMRIHTSSRRAERLIKNLVDFMRARLGLGIPIQRTEVDLNELSRQIIDELSLAHPERKVSLAIAGDVRGNWDRDRIGQVVSNLVVNALKYSPPASDVRVEIDADDLEARLLVHSEGEPIDADMLPRVFEPSLRAAHDSSGKSDGLGLYIVAAIAHAHGGTVEARSSIADGTTMIAHMPR